MLKGPERINQVGQPTGPLAVIDDPTSAVCDFGIGNESGQNDIIVFNVTRPDNPG
jgi:hypothetical protein